MYKEKHYSPYTHNLRGINTYKRASANGTQTNVKFVNRI